MRNGKWQDAVEYLDAHHFVGMASGFTRGREPLVECGRRWLEGRGVFSISRDASQQGNSNQGKTRHGGRHGEWVGVSSGEEVRKVESD